MDLSPRARSDERDSDLAGGLLPRRDVLRRLAQIGLGASAAFVATDWQLDSGIGPRPINVTAPPKLDGPAGTSGGGSGRFRTSLPRRPSTDLNTQRYTRLWSGDFSTGDLSQWQGMLNKFSETGNPYKPRTSAGYAVNVVPRNGGTGYAARFEVRQGDVPPIVGGAERSELAAGQPSHAPIGSTRLYAFSIKFDKTFPLNHHETGWYNVAQFGTYPYFPGTPVLLMGCLYPGAAETRAGYWYLNHVPQVPNPGGGTEFVKPWGQPIAEMPLDPGRWQDIHLLITWKQDETGSIRLWRNQTPQKFNAAGGGSEIFTGQTVRPNSAGQIVSDVTVLSGIYRANDLAATDIVYNSGWRMFGDATAAL